MINIFYITSHFFCLPLAFIFLFLFKKGKERFLVWSFIFIGISSFLNLLLYTILDIEKNLEPALTNLVIGIIFLILSIRATDISKEYDSYNYLRKVILYGFGIYYFFEHIPFLRGVITLLIAIITVIIVNILGFKSSIAGIDYAGYNIFWQYKLNIVLENILEVSVPIIPADINIVLGCTGLREVLLLFFVLYFTKAEKRLKQKVFTFSATIIFISNILRNVIVVYWTGFKEVGFEITHHTIGSILIFFTLLFVVIYVLFKVPEINSHIENIFHLKKI